MEPLTAFSMGWLLTPMLNRFSPALEAWAKRVGLGKELASLNKELAKMDSIRSTYYSQGATQLKVRWLKDLCYDADDLVDELEYSMLKYKIYREEAVQRSGGDGDSQVISSSEGGCAGKLLSKFRRSSSSSIIHGADLHVLAKRMKKLAARLQEVYNEVSNALKSDKLDAVPMSNWETQPMKTMASTLPNEDSRVFGRDMERDYLIDLLTGHEDLSVVSIVGMAGIGKTILAQLVYEDSRVRNHFEEFVWASGFGQYGVPHVNTKVLFDNDSNNNNNEAALGNSEVARVAREMLRQVSGDSPVKIENPDALLNKLADSLRSKKFLIVLDDMWVENEDPWESLLGPLKHGSERGSKILVTTRTHSVARIVHSSETLYLHGLEEEVFWNLFKSRVFDDEWFRRNRNLEIIGRQIAKKLKGVPLAAKTIGALLKRDPDEGHWWRVVEELEGNTKDDTLPALKLIYNNLPARLKQCFNYCALFPRGYPLDREYLMNMWVALGLIIDSKGRRTEDVASEYFDSLVDHGFLERRVGKDRAASALRSSVYVMHDLAKVASSDEFLRTDGLWHKRVPLTVRYMSIIPGLVSRVNSSLELGSAAAAANLRALIFLGNEGREEQKGLEGLASSIGNLKHLRVLKLDATLAPYSLSFLPRMGNLTHLRYLNLSLDLETLPGDICKLYHLQTLDLSDCRKLRELPKKFNNLVNLRHFFAETRAHSMIAGVSRLTSLQELSAFRVKTEREFSITQLRNLKELGGSLGICGLMNVKSKEEAAEARLVDKKFLNSLSLSWDRKDPDLRDLVELEVLDCLRPHPNLKTLIIAGYSVAALPSWLSNKVAASLVNLEHIRLEDCSGVETLPPLGELPFLRQLHLKSMPRVDEIGGRLYGSSHDTIFQSLENMVIEDLPALEAWLWSEGPLLFHALKVLEIKNCPRLRELPLSNADSIKAEGTMRFRCLSSLVINECPSVEKLPALPHTHRLSHISINGVGLSGEFHLSVFREELQLEMSSNHNVRALDEALVFYNLRNLRSLRIRRCPNLTSLSWERVCSLAWLNTLHIEECPQLVSLSEEGLPLRQSLSNLSTLEIVNCRNIPSLPDSLHFLTSLNKLKLVGCELEEFELADQSFVPKKGLRPHLNLKALHILGCGGDNMRSWLYNNITASLVNLVSIYLEDCLRSETLPPLGGLLLLKQLHLKSLPRVCEIGVQLYGSNHDIGFQSLVTMVIEDMPALEAWHWVDGPLLFPALEVLEITNCPKLRELPLSNPESSTDTEGNMWFQCLRSLVIHGSPLVEKLPPLPITQRLSHISIDGAGLLGELYLSVFREELKLEMSHVSALDEALAFHNLKKLRSLCVKRCPNLKSLSWEEGICSLDSLSLLHIEECPRLVSLSEQDSLWPKSLINLSTLEIINCRNLLDLPSNLQSLTSLKKLTIYGCGSNLSFPKILPPSLEQFNVVEPDLSFPKKGLTASLEEFDALELDRPLPQKAFQHRLNG